MFVVKLLLSVLVLAASGVLATGSVTVVRSHKKNKETAEPLLRFPFIHSLANPCSFALEVVSLSRFPALHKLLLVEEQSMNQFDSSEQIVSPAPLRNLTASGDISLAQQALDFLRPYRDLLDVQLSTDPRYLNDNKRKEKFSLIKEFKLVVSQVLHLIRRVYSPASEPHKCSGFQLQSLPQENLVVLSSAGDIQIEELYRSLLIVLAHLHMMIRDVHVSARFCPSESVAHLRIMRQLIGKVETSMCLVLHSAVVTKHKGNANYFRVTHEVLQTFFHSYHFCSAREVRECLVMNYAHQIFEILQRHMRV